MRWQYVGCLIKDVPRELLEDKAKSPQQLRELLKSVPLVEGNLESTNIDALTALLINDGIFPIKIHPINNRDNKTFKLEQLKDKLKHS